MLPQNYSSAIATEFLSPVMNFLAENNPQKTYSAASQFYPSTSKYIMEIKESDRSSDLIPRTVVFIDGNFENGESETQMETRDSSLISQETLESLMAGQDFTRVFLRVSPICRRISEDFWKTIPF